MPELSEWNAAHDQIVGALGTMVGASLQCELESINNAKVAWEKLKEKTHLKGIISKLKCLSSAICSRIVSNIPASTTITKIKDALGAIFKGGPPSNEEWLIVLLLNSLSVGNYNWLRKDLLRFMMNAKIMVTSKDIIEQIITEHCKGTRAVETALAAKQHTTPKSKSKYCMNCKRMNHLISECWEEGSGNHSNAPNWIKKTSGNKSKKKKEKDNAYILKEDSGSETTAFTFNAMKPGYANQLLTSLSDHLEDSYMSYIAHEPASEKVTVEWNENTMHGLVIEEMAAVSSINTPFCFDTSATSHISPFRSYFIKLTLMEPKEIHGVNSSSIPDIGIRVIKI